MDELERCYNAIGPMLGTRTIEQICAENPDLPPPETIREWLADPNHPLTERLRDGQEFAAYVNHMEAIRGAPWAR